MSAGDTVNLLYRSKWSGVIALLPLATAAVSLAGIGSALSNLLLANNVINACPAIDLISAAAGIVLALWLMPVGAQLYLAALVVHASVFIAITLSIFLATSGTAGAAVASAFGPAFVACCAGAFAMETLRFVIGTSGILIVRLALQADLFALAYVAVLRIAFSRPLRELVEVALGGRHLIPLLFGFGHRR
jgi:hypothetical protein